MARRKKLINIVLGMIIGIIVAQMLKNQQAEKCDSDKFASEIYREPLIDNSRGPDKNLLFVGVMTAAKYLNTRAKVVYETWGKQVPGRIAFFTSEHSYSKSIPLVPLPGIDDSYPPQKKSFTMLKYMHDNYIDKFEWFLRADDDVYVRTDRLEKFLRSIDSRKPWFIGQTGRGNTEEFGLLSLENNENFCMGGPGVILSRETLKRIAPHIDECLRNLYTTHEDVEVGRCVKKFAGVSCTWSYEMQVILYHNGSGEAAFTGNLKQKEVHRAITMHPVKHPQYMYRLHDYVKGLKIQDRYQESINLHRDVATSMSYLGVKPENLVNAEIVDDLPLFPEPEGSDSHLGDPLLLGTPLGLNRFKANNLRDVLEWELISKSLFSYKDLNPKRRIGSSLKEGLSDVVREIMEIINFYSKQRGRVIEFNEIFYGYWRLDPIHGVDLILDLLLVYKKYRGHKMTVPVRRHAYMQQTFTGIKIREIDINQKNSDIITEIDLPYHKKIINHVIIKIGEKLPKIPLIFNSAAENTKYINFILPLSGRYETLKRFLGNYEEVCLKEEELTRLYIVLYEDKNNIRDFQKSKNLIYDTQRRYRYSEISTIIIRNETFSRGKALQYGVDSLQGEELLFFVDVDIAFNKRSLLRIRQNTVISKQIYFPIVYSLYNPKLFNGLPFNLTCELLNSEFTTDNRKGFWRQFGFGIVSVYKSDFLDLGGFNMSISGWGLEDVTLYDTVIRSKFNIVRGADPGLVHVYHSIACDSNLEKAQKDMCVGTKANTFGSLYDLQKYFLKYRYLFRL